jgi:hypothetical protein
MERTENEGRRRERAGPSAGPGSSSQGGSERWIIEDLWVRAVRAKADLSTVTDAEEIVVGGKRWQEYQRMGRALEPSRTRRRPATEW